MMTQHTAHLFLLFDESTLQAVGARVMTQPEPAAERPYRWALLGSETARTTEEANAAVNRRYEFDPIVPKLLARDATGRGPQLPSVELVRSRGMAAVADACCILGDRSSLELLELLGFAGRSPDHGEVCDAAGLGRGDAILSIHLRAVRDLAEIVGLRTDGGAPNIPLAQRRLDEWASAGWARWTGHHLLFDTDRMVASARKLRRPGRAGSDWEPAAAREPDADADRARMEIEEAINRARENWVPATSASSLRTLVDQLDEAELHRDEARAQLAELRGVLDIACSAIAGNRDALHNLHGALHRTAARAGIGLVVSADDVRRRLEEASR